MKKSSIVALVFAGALAAPLAMAQDMKQGLSFGGTVGTMKPHGSDNDTGLTIGGRLGKELQDGFSAEADLNLTFSDGELGSNQDYNINSIAAYGVWRSQGDVHFKGKVGVSYWDDDLDNDFSLAAGVGIGIRMGSGVMDIEYTQINDYVDYITVGYSLPFR
jgi:outer membrane immunogenic protein